MSMTLTFEEGGVDYYLPRAGARLTSTATFNKDDEINIDGVMFYVGHITHALSDINNDRAPTSYVHIVRVQELPLTDEQLTKVMLQGFKHA